MKENIINTIESFLKKNILHQPDRNIEADEPLLSSGLIDSFNLMDVALFVEDTYGVRIDDTELNAETFNTLNELADLIVDRQK